MLDDLNISVFSMREVDDLGIKEVNRHFLINIENMLNNNEY